MPKALVVVMSVHAGNTAPSTPASTECAINTAIEHGSPISIVTAEGTPRVLMKSRVFQLAPISNNQAHGDDLKGAQNVVLGTIIQAKATSNGNNLMAAISVASTAGHATANDGVQIIVVDNGLSDTGSVRMSDPGMTMAIPKEVAALVTSNNLCPPLAGTTTTFYGLGATSSPQKPLNQAQVNNITTAWVQTVQTCGGNATAAAYPRTGAGPQTRYTSALITPATTPVLPPHPVNATLTFTDSSALGFQPDNATLRDPIAATAALQQLATYLKNGAQHRVTISGTTANGTTRWPTLSALAKARATTVSKLLVSMGAPTSQITIRGLGYTARPPVTGPATAALNRTVRIHVDS